MNLLSKYRRLIVLLLDLFIFVFFSVLIFALSPSGNGTGSRNVCYVAPNLMLLYLCIFLCQFAFKTYDTLWRYAESYEYLRLLAGVCSGAVLFIIIVSTPFVPRQISYFYILSLVTTSIVSMLLMRFTYRAYRKYVLHSKSKGKRRVIIVGAGRAGVAICDEIRSNSDSSYEIVCFFDDDTSKINRKINGVRVFGPISNISDALVGHNLLASEIIIALPAVNNERRREIVDICKKTKLKIKILPSTLNLVADNTGLVSRIRNINIEDLLGRDMVELDSRPVYDLIRGKTVLVTGGGGSIGSELCRQIAEIGPGKLVIVDIYENNAYDIQQELRSQYGSALNLQVEIASVRDEDKINLIFETYKPNTVFHAAAHKHVPLMEDSPEEAIKNNVFGTWNVIRAADKSEVSQFILISTDKAVRPTNIMGTSKRICEMLLQTMQDSKTKFSAVRFGNVLGSNGSVVPLFKKQIESGGPITITDKRVIRYFMTISEAAQLVLQAAAMKQDGHIFVLDMGEPVKIINLAENLISLSGLRPYEDIKIVEVGLRPGEKLYEELLVNPDILEKTANQKIFIEHQKPIDKELMQVRLETLKTAVESHDREKIRACMHDIVPSFIEAEEVNAKAVESGKFK